MTRLDNIMVIIHNNRGADEDDEATTTSSASPRAKVEATTNRRRNKPSLAGWLACRLASWRSAARRPAAPLAPNDLRRLR